MSKANITLTLDSDVHKKVTESPEKNSELVNHILKRYFFGDEGIKNQIDNHKNQISALQNELNKRQISKKNKIENIKESMKIKLQEEKKILDRNPGVSKIRSRLFNKQFGTDFTELEYLKAIKRWT